MNKYSLIEITQDVCSYKTVIYSIAVTLIYQLFNL